MSIWCLEIYIEKQKFFHTIFQKSVMKWVIKNFFWKFILKKKSFFIQYFRKVSWNESLKTFLEFYGKSLYFNSTSIELVKTIIKEVFISIFTLYRNYRHFSSKNLKVLSSQQKEHRFFYKTVLGIFKITLLLRDRHVFVWRSLKIFNIFSTVTLTQIF